ncbi:MFS transporter [Actinopolymorpha sp. B17G11]|uniref:MFS transporter n=1 Tax=Actinopolymorpha sp. B17G11 TaxID=3160861 RepID=UPI0032E45C49
MATNTTYATLYAVDGALLPFLSLFLAYAHGLSASQIGFVMAAASVSAIVAPPVLTVLADRYGRAELLLVTMLAASSVALLVFAFVGGFWGLLIVYAAFSLVREPTRPLLDGIFFTSQRTIPALAEVKYHRVRFWGTFGFMVPGVILYFVLVDGDALDSLPLLSCGLAVLGLAAALFLPSRRRASVSAASLPGGGPGGQGAPAGRTPTPAAGRTDMRALARAAGRLLRRRTTVVFITSMFLLQASMSAYFAFYPLQATEVVGLSPRWIGLITNLGVALELGYMAAFGWLVARLGWRWLMVLGAAGMAVRVALLAAIPTVGIVVGTQVLHGLVIVVSMVAGRVILDRYAPDEIRHTAQGLYAMIVLGGGKIVGSALGGLIAAQDLSAVFWSAAAVASVAAFGLAWALREEPA